MLFILWSKIATKNTKYYANEIKMNQQSEIWNQSEICIQKLYWNQNLFSYDNNISFYYIDTHTYCMVYIKWISEQMKKICMNGEPMMIADWFIMQKK